MSKHRVWSDPIILALTYALGLAIATIAAVDDVRTRRLRDRYTGPLAAVGVVGIGAWAAVAQTGLPVTSLALGAAAFGGPWLAIHVVSPAAVGLGDVKYAAALGPYLGLPGPGVAVRGFVLATLAGGVAAAVALIAGRRAEPLPFGPALLVGAASALALALPWDLPG